ncbi:MAG: hypothetical protein KGJ13_07990 [Patescibacteria group bacterium]|nr:hypothetical protein [Patescibacteria group bacterium]
MKASVINMARWCITSSPDPLANSRSEAYKNLVGGRKLEIPPDRFARARNTVYMMPDSERQHGRFEYLENRRLPLPMVFASFALAGGVVLVAMLLKLAFIAFHIPIPTP